MYGLSVRYVLCLCSILHLTYHTLYSSYLIILHGYFITYNCANISIEYLVHELTEALHITIVLSIY